MTDLLNTFVAKRSCVGVREKSSGGEDGLWLIKAATAATRADAPEGPLFDTESDVSVLLMSTRFRLEVTPRECG